MKKAELSSYPIRSMSLNGRITHPSLAARSRCIGAAALVILHAASVAYITGAVPSFYFAFSSCQLVLVLKIIPMVSSFVLEPSVSDVNSYNVFFPFLVLFKSVSQAL